MTETDAILSALAAQLDSHARAVDTCLAGWLDRPGRPPRLVAAMRHAAFAGGKRMRPYLVLESARLFGVTGEAPLQVAAALEAIHCYSLVHDDLPSMDNDDMRRGQPTVHRAYDEATAILVGDGLLTLAFEMVASDHVTLPPAVKVALVSALARASGIDGMVGGQLLDLAAEGRFEAEPQPLDLAAIRHLQALKTGALIRFAVEAGALMAPEATPEQRDALTRYGEALGLAFQIRDDLLDVEGDAALVGKAVAKDAAAGKGTFVSLLGIEAARSEVERVSAGGIAAVEAAFGAAAEPLVALMVFNQKRRH
ncbi:MAG: polyprenyl synthetase family protein [Beijerinckiaceae bacterium]|nr:polyprenyl synthetase family protein [Beijerinckiaceae bacterium]MCZ8300777.1 polyprenyl synthetase family protein [Beijerinckiaceae bacterium]